MQIDSIYIECENKLVPYHYRVGPTDETGIFVKRIEQEGGLFRVTHWSGHETAVSERFVVMVRMKGGEEWE